jgi:hypothetical protein
VNNRRKVVLCHDVGGYVPDRDPHVLVPAHGIIKIKIFNVKGGKPGTRRGNDTVKEQFGSGEVSGFSGNFARIFNAIPTTGKTDAVFFFFIGFVFSDHA